MARTGWVAARRALVPGPRGDRMLCVSQCLERILWVWWRDDKASLMVIRRIWIAARFIPGWPRPDYSLCQCLWSYGKGGPELFLRKSLNQATPKTCRGKVCQGQSAAQRKAECLAAFHST